jgi:hypothetical protein
MSTKQASRKPATAKKVEKPKHALTDKHLEYFKERVVYWCFRFGQVDWQLDVEFDKPENDGKDLAAVRYNGDGKRATITLNRVWDPAGDVVSLEKLDQCACHEVMHLFFADLCDLANQHCPPHVDVERIEHAMIRTLENLLFADNNDRKANR